jgi:hypothetical protein
MGALVAWATLFGVRTPWGVININLFPPAITDTLTPGGWWLGWPLILGAVAMVAAITAGLVVWRSR